jgi:hypothetical protein
MVAVDEALTFHITFWADLAAALLCAALLVWLRRQRRRAQSGHGAASAIILPIYEPVLWALGAAFLVQTLLLGVPGPYPATPQWFVGASYQPEDPESASAAWGDATLYFAYWATFELMAEGFGILLLHRSPSPQAFVSTLRWAVLYALAAAAVTTTGFNYELLGLHADLERIMDSVFLAVPCGLYALLMLPSSVLSTGRSSLLPWAIFSLAWRLVSVVAVNTGLYGDTLLGPILTACRSVLTPLVMYATLALDTRYWRDLSSRALASLDGGGGGGGASGDEGAGASESTKLLAGGSRRGGGSGGSGQRYGGGGSYDAPQMLELPTEPPQPLDPRRAALARRRARAEARLLAAAGPSSSDSDDGTASTGSRRHSRARSLSSGSGGGGGGSGPRSPGRSRRGSTSSRGSRGSGGGGGGGAFGVGGSSSSTSKRRGSTGSAGGGGGNRTGTPSNNQLDSPSRAAAATLAAAPSFQQTSGPGRGGAAGAASKSSGGGSGYGSVGTSGSAPAAAGGATTNSLPASGRSAISSGGGDLTTPLTGAKRRRGFLSGFLSALWPGGSSTKRKQLQALDRGAGGGNDDDNDDDDDGDSDGRSSGDDTASRSAGGSSTQASPPLAGIASGGGGSSGASDPPFSRSRSHTLRSDAGGDAGDDLSHTAPGSGGEDDEGHGVDGDDGTGGLDDAIIRVGDTETRPIQEYFNTAAAAAAAAAASAPGGGRSGSGSRRSGGGGGGSRSSSHTSTHQAGIDHVRRFQRTNRRFLVDFSELKIGPFLSRGATSDVYSGVYKGSPVAIKMFRPERIDEAAIAHFHKRVTAAVAAGWPQAAAITTTRFTLVRPPHPRAPDLSLPLFFALAGRTPSPRRCRTPTSCTTTACACRRRTSRSCLSCARATRCGASSSTSRTGARRGCWRAAAAAVGAARSRPCPRCRGGAACASRAAPRRRWRTCTRSTRRTCTATSRARTS